MKHLQIWFVAKGKILVMSRARRFDKSRNCNPQYNRKGCSIHANSKIHSANLSKSQCPMVPSIFIEVFWLLLLREMNGG